MLLSPTHPTVGALAFSIASRVGYEPPKLTEENALHIVTKGTFSTLLYKYLAQTKNPTSS